MPVYGKERHYQKGVINAYGWLYFSAYDIMKMNAGGSYLKNS